jgi:hypothetical protein
MPHIEVILRQIHKDLVPQFEEKLRGFLATQDKEWLIEQIVRLALDAHSLQEMDRKHLQQAKLKERSERLARLEEMALDCPRIIAFVEQYAPYDRDKLIHDGYLWENAPIKGSELIRDAYRTPEGNALLLQAKDVLFGLLFGDASCNIHLRRIQRELLTFTLPRFKAGALDFMKAATQFSGAGTWQDPDCVSDDECADNAIFEVEFGEVEGEWVGRGIIQAMRLINHLEVNEQILYARMINIEESTLIV